MRASDTARARFKRAYSMARTAIRGRQRQALKLDLQLAPDYSPTCRRCDAGALVAGKVAAALGYSDQVDLAIHTYAVVLALGGTYARQPRMPRPLDFDGWSAWRAWTAQVRAAA